AELLPVSLRAEPGMLHDARLDSALEPGREHVIVEGRLDGLDLLLRPVTSGLPQEADGWLDTDTALVRPVVGWTGDGRAVIPRHGSGAEGSLVRPRIAALEDRVLVDTTATRFADGRIGVEWTFPRGQPLAPGWIVITRDPAFGATVVTGRTAGPEAGW